MKKTFLFGIVAAMLATACTEEESFNQIASGEGITFTSSVASRATDNSFEPGDKIGISMYANGAFASSATNVEYTTVDGTTFTGTDITWEAAGGASLADFIGVYPYKDGSISSTTYSFTISNEDGATLSGNDVMYACSSGITTGTDNVSLAFKHKLVKVVMNVKKQDGTAITDATVTIDKQQLAGTMDLLNEGTVTATGDATGTMSFKFNSKDSQYEAIVMPSEVVAGRAITITSDGKTYSCPVGDLAFESGTKMTLSATIIEGTGTGDVTIINPQVISVVEWTGGVSEDYVFDADAEINVTGKTPYTLATNKALSDTPITINEFEGTLNADDAYCLSYTISDAASASAISRADGEYSIMVAPIEGDGEPKEYILPKNQISGQLLIAVEENTTGIKVSGTEGITLNEVLVYTSQAIELPAQPVVLWTGDGTLGNGIVGEGAPGYEPAGWRHIIAQFTLTEEQRALFVPGATLKCYYSDDFSGSNSIIFGLLPLSGSVEEGSSCLSVVVTSSMCEEVQNNAVVLVMDWGTNTGSLNRVELVPAESENWGYLLWYSENPCQMDYGRVNFGIPASLAVGDVIRVHCQNVVDGAKIGGYDVTWANEEVLTPLLDELSVSQGAATVDLTIDQEALTALQAMRTAIRPITLKGNGLTVTQVELVRAGGN